MPRRRRWWTGASSAGPWPACEETVIVRLTDLIRSPDPVGDRPTEGAPAAPPAGGERSGSPANNGKRQPLPGDATPTSSAAAGNPAPAGTPPAGDAGRRPAGELVGELESAVSAFLDAARANRPLPLTPLEALAARLVDGLAAGEGLVMGALEVREGQHALAAHCIHVAVYAVRIAAAMGYPPAEHVKVALAGLLHDVGMVRFLPDFASVERTFTAREREALTRHPEEGFKILSALGPAYRWLAEVAHQEHEREDGSGYPRGLSGDQIVETAGIVALADIYEALTHPRPHRKALVPFEAVRQILTSERRRFSEAALKGLIKGLSAFPVGSLVRLNTREVGRVVAGNPAFPLRPVVEVLFGAAGERVQGRHINLAQNSLQYIVDSVAVHEEP